VECQCPTHPKQDHGPAVIGTVRAYGATLLRLPHLSASLSALELLSNILKRHRL